MNTKQLIEKLGGSKKVQKETGLSKGRISQWISADQIPTAWLKFYQVKRRDISWSDYSPTKQ